nr:hypothetical protein [Tanacetum cinerariifolium]
GGGGSGVEEGGDEVMGGGWIYGGCGVRGDGDDGGSEWVGDGGVAVAGWPEVWPDPVTAPEKLEKSEDISSNNISRIKFNKQKELAGELMR